MSVSFIGRPHCALSEFAFRLPWSLLLPKGFRPLAAPMQSAFPAQRLCGVGR